MTVQSPSKNSPLSRSISSPKSALREAERSRSPRRFGILEDMPKYEVDPELLDGHAAQDIFTGGISKSGYTYDDLIVLPGQINFGVHEVVLDSHFTKNIRLHTPIVSSPMDTVTESKMAIAMALEGGVGIIHTNMPIEDQVNEVMKVKKYKSGFITDPICISPTMLLSDLDELGKKCGFTGFPVTEDGRMAPSCLAW
jgi:IMP dehydrogenase